MAYIKFYRGTSTSYNATTHENCVYFCTDTKELKLNGDSYGISDDNLSLLLASVKSVSVAGNVLTFTFNNGSSGALTLPTATSSSAGVMSAADKNKLDGIAEGANKTTIDSALSSTSTNPVLNKIINSALAGKANSSHTHSIANVTNLLTTLDGKVPTSRTINSKALTDNVTISGADIATTNYSKASSASAITTTDTINSALGKLEKALDGKSNSGHTHNYAGSSSAGGAANSVKSNITIKLNSGTTEDTNLYTYNGSTAKTINITPSSIGAATSGHNHDGAYAKNTFSKVTVGSTTIEADSIADTLTFAAGSNITITPDATNDKITIASTIPNAGSSIGGVKSGGDVTISNGIITVNDDSHNHVIGNIDNLLTTLDAKAPLASPALTGTPTAPTAGASTNNTQIATTAFVNTVVNNKIAASDAMIYKGTLGTKGTITELPNTTAKTGWTYKVITAGTYASLKCEVGDMIICLTDGSTSTEATWTVVQTNIDGAVTGPASSVDNRVVTFNGTSGKAIKDSGYTIAASVPSGAKFTDTTYSAGTGLSLSNNTFSLSESGVTAGSYGPTANVAGTNGTTISVPLITVDSLGRVTSVASRTYTSKDTTYGIATNATSGLVKPWYNHTAASTGPTAGSNATAVAVNAISTSAGRYYALEMDNAGRGFVNVPWSNTTYSANNGISLSGTTFSNSGVRSITAGSSANLINVNTNGTTSTITINNVATATNATKATQDSAGLLINTTYIKNLSVSGKVITYTKGDGTTGTISTQDTWRGIVNNLTSTATDLSLSAALGKILNDTKAVNKTLTSEDLNSVTTPGFYNGGGNNTVTNKPSGIDNFGLIVTHNASGEYYTLILLDGTGQKSYRRGCSNSTWSAWVEDKLTDTTYGAGAGISLSGTTFSNSGVRSIASGSTNGTISVNTNGTSANVAVKGLGSAAYTASTSYAKASHTHTGAQVTMNGYSTISGGSITASDTINTAINKLEDMLIWHEA